MEEAHRKPRPHIERRRMADALTIVCVHRFPRLLTWKTTAKKLWRETRRVSCHCRVKYMAKEGFSSAPLRYGRTGGREAAYKNTR